MHATKRVFLFLALVTGLTALGCDQNNYENSFDIPEGEDGLSFVQFDAIDTTTIYKSTFSSALGQAQSGETQLSVEAPFSFRSDFTVSFETVGDAVPGVDYTIVEEEVDDTTNVIDTLNYSLPVPDEFVTAGCSETPVGPSCPIIDTVQTDNGMLALVVDTTESIVSYQIAYNDDAGTGTISVPYDEVGGRPNAGNLIDNAEMTLIGLGNQDRDEPVSATIRLTSAEAASGQQIEAGRPRDEGNFATERTVLIGQADIFTINSSFTAVTSLLGYGEVEVGEDSTQSVILLNTGDVTGRLSDFEIVGLDSGAYSVSAPQSIDLGTGPANAVPVQVTFSPEGAGVREAALVFDVANDFDQTTVSLDLVGSGGDGDDGNGDDNDSD